MSTPDTQGEINRRLDRDLSGVAKILAGIFATIAGVGAAFGLSQESLLVAVNNNLWLFIGVAALALVAIALSIWSLFQGNDRKGNRKQSLILGGSVVFYLAALTLAIGGVAGYATGNGHPNVSELSITTGSPLKLHFAVHADGVKNSEVIIAEVKLFKDEEPVGGKPLYQTLLHSDDNGRIDQRVEFIIERGEANRLTVRIRPDHVHEEGAYCEANQTTQKLGCSTVILPLAVG